MITKKEITQVLDEIPAFETFLHKMGFKRIEGAIYGLLVLSENPLSSEEIEKILNLSQSAVSLALKSLAHYGAVETRDCREKRLKTHTAKNDSLSIVATIFKKREQETIEEFKQLTIQFLEQSETHQNARIHKLKSIISTCETSEAVMNFVITLSQKRHQPYYRDVVNKLPKVLDFVLSSSLPLSQGAEDLKKGLTKKLKTWASSIERRPYQ
jgi:DNA-binding transcriptional regulator GbsR (MarR family)